MLKYGEIDCNGKLKYGLVKSALKIPAGTKTHTYAECMPSVSKSVLAEKMKVYAYGFHAHFIGKALWFDLWDSDLYSEEDG